MTIIEESGESDHDLPDSIQSALKDRYGPFPEVSSEIDRAILTDARQYLSAGVQPVRRYWRRNSWRWMALASTMAAASVMLLAQRTPQSEPNRRTSMASRTPGPPMRSVARDTVGQDAIGKDFDQNGRVDILDAFAMARLLGDGRTDRRSEEWDVNGDGHFDQEDVDLVANEAVML